MWAFLRGEQILVNELDYLDRLQIIRTPLFGVYLHRIHAPDLYRDPHTHPWWFASLVLSGGYTEEIDGSAVRVRDRFSLRVLSRRHAHRITETRGILWTLVITGPRRSSWGFRTPQGYMDWRLYLAPGNEFTVPPPKQDFRV